MDEFFDFEQALVDVKSKKTQKYLREVLSTYKNREYRSCIVMLYAVTFTDALEKIKTLADMYQNAKAEKFLEEFNKNRKNNKPYSSLEKDIKEFIVDSGLLSDVEKKEWEHLKDYRDYCAHPVVGKEYELISPNAEQVRNHIRNMFEALFLKDALVADNSLFEEFIIKIENFYDRNNLEGFEEYVKTRYITKLDLMSKCKFIKKLWKFSFGIDDDECNTYRRIAYRSLIWIIESDKTNILKYMNENIEYFNGKIVFQDIDICFDEKEICFYNNRSLALVFLLYKIPEIYEMLSKDNQVEIKSIIEKNINLIFMSSYVYKNSQLHKDKILEGLSGINYCLDPVFIEELSQKAYEEFNYYYNDVITFYFFNCLNSSQWSPDFKYINWTYRDILMYMLPYFTKNQLDVFLEQLSPVYIQASCFRYLAYQIKCIIDEKKYDIDLNSYDINILKYID